MQHANSSTSNIDQVWVHSSEIDWFCNYPEKQSVDMSPAEYIVDTESTINIQIKSQHRMMSTYSRQNTRRNILSESSDISSSRAVRKPKLFYVGHQSQLSFQIDAHT